jgi:hypothetical protein
LSVRGKQHLSPQTELGVGFEPASRQTSEIDPGINPYCNSWWLSLILMAREIRGQAEMPADCIPNREEHVPMPNYRFGKHPPKLDYRTLRFKSYLTPQIAPPPPAVNVLTRVYAQLKTADPTKLFPMDGNDTLGDCTVAALAHAITVYRGLVGAEAIMSKQAVVKLYMHLTGGVDSGMNEADVLNYWRQNAVSTRFWLTPASIRKTTPTWSWPFSSLAAFIWGSRFNKTAFRSSTPTNPGHQARSPMTATRSLPLPTIRTA